MNRQGLASMHVSPLHLQQGVMAMLALLVTLIAGQQWARWEQVQPPAPQVMRSVVVHHPFSAFKSASQVSGHYDRVADGETRTADSQPVPQSWVF
ncbi:hypothetical protein [Pseudomonas sp.]|uniref:hypothetical protein n=1 Tax=Pseudomonas sp. TaxID=306 RepID=UPI00261222F0|nr:hypothetical protein [Pseudomonas sp.]